MSGNIISALFIHRENSKGRFPSKTNIVLKVPLSVYLHIEVLLDICVWFASLRHQGYDIMN